MPPFSYGASNHIGVVLYINVENKTLHEYNPIRYKTFCYLRISQKDNYSPNFLLSFTTVLSIKVDLLSIFDSNISVATDSLFISKSSMSLSLS